MSVPPVRPVAPGVMSVAVSVEGEPHFTWTPAELSAALSAAAADPTARVVLLEGGSTYFSAGGDRDLLVGPDAENTVPALCAEIPPVLLDTELPVIGVAAGHAMGGGFALLLCCDLVLLASESLYGANFVTLGFTPGMGASVLLADTVGEPLAREMLFTGRLMKGRELARTGGPLAHAVWPRNAVRARAMEIAEEMAGHPRETLVALKRLLNTRRRAAVLEAVQREQPVQVELMRTPRIRSRVAAAYGMPAGLEDE